MKMTLKELDSLKQKYTDRDNQYPWPPEVVRKDILLLVETIGRMACRVDLLAGNAPPYCLKRGCEEKKLNCTQCTLEFLMEEK
jgi:hypothetical protein